MTAILDFHGSYDIETFFHLISVVFAEPYQFLTQFLCQAICTQRTP